MIARHLDWRLWLAVLAVGIVSGTIFYSQYLANKIALEERQKVELWVQASKAILTGSGLDLALPNRIRNEQQSIPIIETNEKDSIISFVNLDSIKASTDPAYLPAKLKQFRSQNRPLEIKFNEKPYVANRYYYGHTKLLDEVRYYPVVQLLIVALFVLFILYSISIRNKATQNQVWAGMAKETAHQLGTPISSLQGWIEMLKEDGKNDAIIHELQKDIDRLNLVSDRFSKIGSTPHLERADIIPPIQHMVDYIRKRATGRVQFLIRTNGLDKAEAYISKPLFDWVIENLLKNALDAMEGKGDIIIDIRKNHGEILVDVCDTGKGIAPANIRRVFKPGFTTKKRGWGLGLSLSKRIIDQYHRGQLYVKQSELGKGTTFRMQLQDADSSITVQN